MNERRTHTTNMKFPLGTFNKLQELSREAKIPMNQVLTILVNKASIDDLPKGLKRTTGPVRYEVKTD